MKSNYRLGNPKAAAQVAIRPSVLVTVKCLIIATLSTVYIIVVRTYTHSHYIYIFFTEAAVFASILGYTW